MGAATREKPASLPLALPRVVPRHVGVLPGAADARRARRGVQVSGWLSEVWDDAKLAVAAAADAANPASYVPSVIAFWNTGSVNEAIRAASTPTLAAEAEKQNAERAGREYDPARAAVSAYGGGGLVLDATTATARDVDKKVTDTVNTVHSVVTSPWFWVAVGVTAVGVIAGPFVARWVK